MNEKYFYSVVIPFFNREWCIERAVLSAIRFSPSVQKEIILVDDGSTDASAELTKRLVQENSSGNVDFKFLQQSNSGVCSAKNAGGNFASGKWIVFLDSDDELITTFQDKMQQILEENSNNPLHFFSSLSEDAIVRPENTSGYSLRNINSLLLLGTGGEALPVVRADVFKRYNYDQDIKGYESLSYLRILREYEHAMVHKLVARRYYTQHEDRLSSRAGMKKRWRDISRGHLRVLREHSAVLTQAALVKQLLRILKSKVLSFSL